MRRRLTILVLTISVCLCAAGARQPALALTKDDKFNLAVFSLGSVGFYALAYYLWKNSPAQRAKGYRENLGPGEWYVAAYTGLSYLPEADWNFWRGFSPTLTGHTARNVCYDPGVIGGLKFGRYFDTIPWLGMELETNFSRHAVREQRVSLSPPLPNGQATLLMPRYRFYVWAMQLNLLARYGLRKDKEVTFGRLQPYLGIGPGFEVLYGVTDSAKNFAIGAMAGIRYMLTLNVGLFCEYKFSYQFDVEVERVVIPPYEAGKISMDVPHHRIVIGVSYHFKNLYGN